ncbi:MAG: L-aspartate oxidase [Deltaproteobacteria bacterium]|nr:L-aspartate oxidase [Deltaproteobacteria bacterium]
MSHETDFLVIGGGLAGLTFAMHAARHGSVTVLAKGRSTSSASDKAQGGIASVVSEHDSFEDHERDTLRAGAGLCHEDIVRLCIQGGPESIAELESLGVPFSRMQDDQQAYDLGKEGGHSHRRILHAGDFTGHEIMQALHKAVRAQPGIRLLEDRLAVNLIVERADHPVGVCRGAYVLDQNSGQIETHLGSCTVLATGGAGKVYVYTSNPDMASGDGMAMAYRAGAEMCNMEFVQFHPTCLYHPRAKSFLLSEAMRGEGGKLRLADGSEFLEDYDERGSLATRDIVARAIDFELKKRGDDCVLLDMTALEADYLVKRFANIHRRCLEYGLDMTAEPLPVVPAAHYFCGGVRADARGRSSVPGLYAIGELANTGLHGANRLASNSLLEAVVFGRLAAKDAVEWAARAPAPAGEPPSWDPGDATDSDEMVVVSQNWDEIRRFMWSYVGIVRSDKRLERALRRMQILQEEIREYYWNFLLTSDLVELRNIAVVAELVIRSAQHRTESRGLHYTLDHPEADDRLLDTIIQRDGGVRSAPIHPSVHYDWI